MASPSRLRPTSLALVSFIFLVYVWARVIVPLELVEIRAQFGFSLAQGGLLATVFTLGVTVMAIPAGIFAMRFGTRASLVLGVVLFSLCTGWTGLGLGFTSMFASRIAGGIGESFYNISLLSMLGRSTAKHRAAAAGFPASLFGIGMFLAPSVIGSAMVLTGGWRMPFFLLAAIGLASAALLWVTLGGEQAVREPRAPLTMTSVRALCRPANLALLAVVAIDGIAAYSFIGLYQTFLRSDQGFSLATASVVFSAFGLGQLIGGVPLGWLADRMQRRRYLPVAIALAAVIGTSIFALPASVPLATVCALLFGMATNSIWVVSIALIQDQVEPAQIPLATGTLAIFYYGTASFSGWLLASAQHQIGWTGAAALLYGAPYAIALIAVAWLVRGSLSSHNPA